MSSSRGAGVVLAVLVCLMCRPAPADTLMFSFSAAAVENILASDPNFGGGNCGTPPQPGQLCAVTGIDFTPSLTNGDTATIGNLVTPIPVTIGSGDTGQYVWYDTVTGDAGRWYAGWNPADPFETFLTASPGVQGNTFKIDVGGDVRTITATAPMTSTDVFSFTVTTHGPNAATDTKADVNLNLYVFAEVLNPDGTDTGISFYDTAYLGAPEGSTVWLSLFGIAALVLAKRRGAVARLGRRA